MLRSHFLFRRKRSDDRLDAELNFHIDQQIRRYLEQGYSPEEASRKAKIEFGGLEQVKEECRDLRPLHWIDGLVRDVRFSLRILLKNKGFAFAALLTLTLCIGANTAIFSMLYAFVFKPLPFPALGRIVEVLSASTKSNVKLPCSVVQYLDFRSHTGSFANLAYSEYEEFTLGGGGKAFRSLGLKTTAELFGVLGLNPAHGRFFVAENNRSGNDKVVVPTQSFCRSHFGYEKNALGKTLRINGESYEIVGIAPDTVEALDTRLRFFIPLVLSPQLANPLNRYLVTPGSHVYGLLKPKETIGSASSTVAAIENHFQAGLPLNIRKMLDGSKIEIAGLQSRQADDVKARLYLMQGVALFVLLIGCVNVAGLFLARTNSRQGEMALRIALGAGRRTIVRLLLAESLLLTFLGAVFALVFSSGLVSIINHFALYLLPGRQPVAIDSAMGGFTLLTAFPVALFISLFPVLNVFGKNLAESMHVQTRHVSGGLKLRRMTGALVIIQIAVTSMLLVGAGLLVRSFAHALAVNPGLNTGHLITGRIALKPGYDRSGNLKIQQQILSEFNKIPGFVSLALAQSAPYSNARPFRLTFAAQDYTVPPGESTPAAVILGISPEYLKTLQVPLLEGRWFNDADMESNHLVLVVNQDLARRYFGTRSAVGRHLTYGVSKGPNDRPEIIGVVGNTRDLRWEREWGPSQSYIYAPMNALPVPSVDVLCLLIRSSRPDAETIELLRAAVKRIDPDLPVFDISSMDNLLSESLNDRRAIMLLLVSFAGIALLLSAVGIYGTLAYEVSQRTREIGIRGAIGCTRKQLLGLVIQQGMRKAGIGLALGIIGALWLCRFLSNQLFEVLPSDPIVYLGVAVLIPVIAILASYIPAHRAGRIDPVIALRSE